MQVSTKCRFKLCSRFLRFFLDSYLDVRRQRSFSRHRITAHLFFHQHIKVQRVHLSSVLPGVEICKSSYMMASRSDTISQIIVAKELVSLITNKMWSFPMDRLINLWLLLSPNTEKIMIYLNQKMPGLNVSFNLSTVHGSKKIYCKKMTLHLWLFPKND